VSSSFLQPLPVSVPFSGTTDATGAFSFTTFVRQSFWCTVKVSAEAQGGAVQWAVRGGGGLPLDYGSGPRLSVGPFVVAPSDHVTISVVGAQPNTAVIGNIWGKQFPDASGAADALNLSANPLTVSTFEIVERIGTIQTVGNGDTITRTFTVPTGTLGVGYIISGAAGFTTPASITVAGDVTTDDYIFTPGSPGAVTARFFPPDVNAVCSVTSQAGPGAPARVTFLALSYNPTVNVTAQTAAPLAVKATGLPAPWQAAGLSPVRVSANLAVGATVDPIAGVAGQTVYLFYCELWVDNLTVIDLEDTSGNFIGGGRSPAAGLVMQVHGYGAPVGASGVGLRILNRVGNPVNVEGTVVASQA